MMLSSSTTLSTCAESDQPSHPPSFLLSSAVAQIGLHFSLPLLLKLAHQVIACFRQPCMHSDFLPSAFILNISQGHPPLTSHKLNLTLGPQDPTQHRSKPVRSIQPQSHGHQSNLINYQCSQKSSSQHVWSRCFHHFGWKWSCASSRIPLLSPSSWALLAARPVFVAAPPLSSIICRMGVHGFGMVEQNKHDAVTDSYSRR